MVFLVNSFATIWLNFEYAKDPAFQLKDGFPKFYKVVHYLVTILFAILILIAIWQVVQLIKVWKSRLGRHKVMFLFSASFMIAFCLIWRFSQNHYHNYSGFGLMANLAVMNTYIWGIQFLYAYSAEGKFKQDVRKTIQKNFEENNEEFKYIDN